MIHINDIWIFELDIWNILLIYTYIFIKLFYLNFILFNLFLINLF